MANGRTARIIFHGVPPVYHSAYGKNCLNICKRLKDSCEVWVSPVLSIGDSELEYEGIKILPSIFQSGDSWGMENLRYWIEKKNPDLIFNHMDIWTLGGNLSTLDRKFTTLSPVDHDPLPELMKADMKTASINFAMSKWGERVMRNAGITNTRYFPHGVDLNVYRPMDKGKCREDFGLSKDAFVLGFIGANHGPRKHIPGLLRAFRKFVDLTGAKPNDVKLLLWTYVHRDRFNQMGDELPIIWEQLGIGDYIKHPPSLDYLAGVSEEEMARLYNSADVFVTASLGEGHCLPITESQACGVPAITPNFSAMPELVEGCGKTARIAEYMSFQLTSSWQAVVDTDDLARVMAEFYESKPLRENYSQRCLEKAKGFGWDKLVQERLLPALQSVL